MKSDDAILSIFLIETGVDFTRRFIYENRSSKMKFFGVRKFFSLISISKMSVKMNFRIRTKKSCR